MNWLKRLFHTCDTPDRLPVTEDQRVWGCRECGATWVWTELENGVGWAKWPA